MTKDRYMLYLKGKNDFGVFAGSNDNLATLKDASKNIAHFITLYNFNYLYILDTRGGRVIWRYYPPTNHRQPWTEEDVT